MFMASIESLVIGMPMPSVITLRPSNAHGDDMENMVLPIWIGTMEATAIAAALDERDTHKRPLTHELANNMVHALGGQIGRVVIDKAEGSTFFATIYVRCSNGMFTRVDARPSDAIALAIRADVPLFVEEEVFRAAACPRSFGPGSDESIEIEEFHKFIEDVEPADFR